MKDALADELLDPDEIMELDPREELLNDIDAMQSEVSEVQQSVATIKQLGDPITNGTFFVEMSDLASRATSVLDSCKEDIERSSILDAELISAYAGLIKATRDIIADYVTIYRDRQKHLDKLELENVKQEHKKEILIMKDNLDKSLDDSTGDHKIFVQEAVVDFLDKRDKGRN
jgi:hypothetical protein